MISLNSFLIFVITFVLLIRLCPEYKKIAFKDFFKNKWVKVKLAINTKITQLDKIGFTLIIMMYFGGLTLNMGGLLTQFLIAFILVLIILKLYKKTDNNESKFSIKIIAFLLTITFLVLGVYIHNINTSSEFIIESHIISNFGALGDYIGGTINPILSFFTIIILLFGGYKQHKQYKEQLLKQQSESKKNDFDRMFTLMLEQHNAFFLQNEFNSYIDNIYANLTEKEIKDKNGNKNVGS